MKIVIVLVVLIALYLSFLFNGGTLYSASQDAMDWLNTIHGRNGYFGVLLLLTGLAVYLFTLEKSDKKNSEHITDELIKHIKDTGVYATTTENTGFGEVHLNAAIKFQDSGFILTIKQNSNGENDAILVNKKFLSWTELLKFIDLETKFSLLEFTPSASPEFQLPQKGEISSLK
ncbi:MAG: hypothetical protein PVJ72_09220 [Gammaproteobacteria bacterium]|jgi:hypothetical protein